MRFRGTKKTNEMETIEFCKLTIGHYNERLIYCCMTWMTSQKKKLYL